jgi:hypothetical protein
LNHALTLSVEDIVTGELRYLPKYASFNSRDILCRPVGPSAKRSYIACVQKREFDPSNSANYLPFQKQAFSRLIPAEITPLLKEAEDTGQLLALAAHSVFPESVNVFEVHWKKGGFNLMMKCGLCEQLRKNKTEEGNNTEGFASPAATNIAFSNIWGTVIASAACDHHYKLNHRLLADDLQL